MAMKKTIVALTLLGMSAGALAQAVIPSPSEKATVYDVKWLTNVQPQIDSGAFYIADENNNWWDGTRTYDLNADKTDFSFDSGSATFKGRATDPAKTGANGKIDDATETDPSTDIDVAANWTLNSIVYRGLLLDGNIVEFDSEMKVDVQNEDNTASNGGTAAAAGTITTRNNTAIDAPLATDASIIEVVLEGDAPTMPTDPVSGAQYTVDDFQQVYTLLTITADSII